MRHPCWALIALDDGEKNAKTLQDGENGKRGMSNHNEKEEEKE